MAFRALALRHTRTCSRLVRHRAPVFQQHALSSEAGSSSGLHEDRPNKRQLIEEREKSREAQARTGFSTEEWSSLKNQFDFPPAKHASTPLTKGKDVTIHGFLQKRKGTSSKLTFVDVKLPGSTLHVQLISQRGDEDSPAHEKHKYLKSIPAHSAVAVTGKVVQTTVSSADTPFPKVQIEPTSIQVLNAFPKDISVTPETVYPPSARHLQLRFGEALPRRIAFRAKVAAVARRILDSEQMVEIETPLLFKSTPEGAREFLVPTRKKGKAYALPQSPQQFKQMLMCAGMSGYYQLARCFRDEDLRADRQPEFTQLDLEKSFATGDDVMRLVEALMKGLSSSLQQTFVRGILDGEPVPFRIGEKLPRGVESTTEFPPFARDRFKRISYDEAMEFHGSDKPDLRIKNANIQRITHMLPPDAISKISSIPDPIIDACRFRLTGADGKADPAAIASFVQTFCSTLDANLPAAVAHNPDGLPTILVYDPTKPLGGLSFLGHEAVSALTSSDPTLPNISSLEPLDVLILQARPEGPFTGGSTALGTIRAEFYRQAVAAGLLPRDDSFHFVWVTGFPMFTATDPATTEPGRGGSAGFSATHHPFTAPLTPKDTDVPAIDPLAARADHYDLVVNGVELGGGSRRIHNADLQKYVFEKILGMDDERVKQFKHLLEALRAGCPPHAGFALGFDRLVAVLSGTRSVRDVIAFPKNMKGEDMAVGSPGRLTSAEAGAYGLEFKKYVEPAKPEGSIKKEG